MSLSKTVGIASIGPSLIRIIIKVRRYITVVYSDLLGRNIDRYDRGYCGLAVIAI